MPAQLEDLLSRWEAARDDGLALSPEELCADRPQLLDELRRSIVLLERLERLLGTDEGREASPSASEGEPAVPNLEILGVLGRGGMGVVYRARDRTLNRIVAVKMLRRNTSSSALQRFEREAQALARLRHENIVPIYEAELHHGRPYFVMEFVRGGSLADQLPRYVGDSAATARLMQKVARAVHHAHEHGVLHRDLKPANILLDDDGEPFVSDFGVAKLVHSAAADTNAENSATTGSATTDERPVTVAGTVPGTPLYMAPEQFDPSRGTVDSRTDVWALGVVLYELLTGLRPFPAALNLGTPQSVCFETPAAPHSLNRKVDRRLEAIALRCLQKEPAQRYATAGQVADELLRWQNGEALEVLPEGRFQTWRRRVRQHPVRWMAALLLLVVVGFVAVASQRPEQVPAPLPEPIETEEERYRRAVAPHLETLARGEAVTLVGSEVGQPAYYWRFGSGRRLRSAADAPPNELLVSTLEPSLLEFLPQTGRDAYRIRATVQHRASVNRFGSLGIFCRRWKLDTDEGPQYYFVHIGFADVGAQATAFPNKGKQGNYFTVNLWRLGTSQTFPLRASYNTGEYLFYVPPVPEEESGGPVRDLLIEVQPDRVMAWWEGRAIVLDVAHSVQEWLPFQKASMPELREKELQLPATGAIGIYLYGGVLSIREFKVEPIPLSPVSR